MELNQIVWVTVMEAAAAKMALKVINVKNASLITMDYSVMVNKQTNIF